MMTPNPAGPVAGHPGCPGTGPELRLAPSYGKGRAPARKSNAVRPAPPPLAGFAARGHILNDRNAVPRSGPMTTFDDRENAFENKYAHDEEMKFKAEMRRNKLLGLWAAELLGKTGAEADTYAVEVVKSDFEEAGHEDVVRKVAGDLGDLADADTIRGKMDELLLIAKGQLVNED